MAIDISGLGFFMPIFGFVFIFLIVYAILKKTKLLGGNNIIDVLISFMIGVIFVTVSSIREYIEVITPWFAVLIVVLLFVLMIVGLSQKKMDDMMKPGLAWVFIVVLILIVLISAINVFNADISPYFPGGRGADEGVLKFIYSSQFGGAVLLLIIAALVAWAITRKS